MDDERTDEELDAEQKLVAELSEPLYERRKWIRVAALTSIVVGIGLAFQGWTILWCWVPIWLGAILYQSVRPLEEAHTSGSRFAFREGVDKLAHYLTVMAVTNLILLLILALLSLGVIASIWRYL